jgi:hypothetical protein
MEQIVTNREIDIFAFTELVYSPLKFLPMKKNILTKALTLATLFLIPAMLIAGKPFEGIMTYKISYPDSKFTEAQLTMFPKIMTVSVKGSKARTEMNVGGGTTVEIVDYNTKSKIALINMMGQKYAIKQTKEEIDKENTGQPKGTVTMTSETKSIAGYLCKKAVVNVDDDGVKSTYDVWFTEELGTRDFNFDNPLYKDINGVLMEFVAKTPQVTMKFTTTNVEKKSVADKDFEIPSDYTITTQEELKSKFGGGE